MVGVSDVTLRNIRKGRSEPNPLNKRRLEDALQWAPGSIEAILAGSNPTRSIDAARARAEAFAAETDDSDDMVLISREALEAIQEVLKRVREPLATAEQIVSRELARQRSRHQQPASTREDRRATG